MPLYEYYRGGNEDAASIQHAVDEAGKAAGRFLKEVLLKDKRTFETREEFAREYRWTGEERI